MALTQALVQERPGTEREKAVRIQSNRQALQPSLPPATHQAPIPQPLPHVHPIWKSLCKEIFQPEEHVIRENAEETGSSPALQLCLSPDLEIRNSSRDYSWFWEWRKPSLSRTFHPEPASRV